jgi:catechol 2,3-dioxygenase-like lactoylglutathione lyase family enzyme
MSKPRKARAIGINHVALEVDDIDAALEFYGKLFEFELRGRSDSMAFVDLGDQFMNFSAGRRQAADDERHFGLVVDDRQSVLDTLDELGIPLLPGPFKDFLDPWGNRIELVDYATIQFSKTPQVLRGMGLEGLDKTEDALDELREKGMAPD